MNPYTFKLSDSSVNDYGTRVLTEGINIDRFKSNPIMLWMHRRDDGGFLETQAPLPIGRWENIRVEGDDLLADAVFDENDEFALQIKDKVDQKILNAASIGLSIIDLSEDPAVMLPGQTRATISKSELVEASIVDIPGNKNAVRLYNKGAMLKLSLPDVQATIPEIKSKTENNMKKFALTTLAAIAAFFGKKTDEEMEFSQDHLQKMNDELQSRSDKVATLTTEIEGLKTQLTTATAEKNTVDESLAAANTKVTSLEAEIATLKSENETLKSNPGSKPAKSPAATDSGSEEGKVKLSADSDDFMTNVNNLKRDVLGK